MASKAQTCLWFQKELSMGAKSRGCHNVTNQIKKGLPEVKQLKMGLLNIVIKHTSASIVLNECWDSDVREDMEMMLNKLAPEGLNYKHSCEGPDDMPAHVKAALLGSSINIPITDGQLNMGTWQGVWLCEHRDRASSRHLVCTIQGASK